MNDTMPEINQTICTLCGVCIQRCVHGALSLIDKRIVLDKSKCAYCGDCEGICPVGAIALPYEIVLLPQTTSQEAPDGHA